MLPDRVSNPGPLTYESGALPIALRGPAKLSLEGSVCYGMRDRGLFSMGSLYFVTPVMLSLANRIDATHQEELNIRRE